MRVGRCRMVGAARHVVLIRHASGEMIVVTPDQQGKFRVIGRVAVALK